MKHRPALRAAFIALSAALALSACNTVEGAGKDFKAAGQAVSDTAQKTKEKINK